ncbi:MAG: FtsH protease activity modulator HflK [Deltaproteobacteria bacterium]|nr:FtsH protease activity modulator HflK [Deltaproteobacteria bacterium]
MANNNVFNMKSNGAGPDKFIAFLKKLSFVPVLIFLALITIPSVVYTVATNENAIVLRFGKYHRTELPGLNFKYPFGIEENINIPVTSNMKMEFGFRTKDPGVRTTYVKGNFDNESIMLTGDLNVVDLTWIIQYQITNAKDFLFNVHDVQKNLFDISQAVVREVVGDHTVTETIIEAREEIGMQSLAMMQKILDEYKMGVKLVTLKLQDVVPPDKVKPSFDEVNAAVQDANQIANIAERQRQKLVQEEKGKADQIIQQAEAYKIDIINRAEGDANRFLALYQEYKKAPMVTKKRLYFEKMRTILAKTQKIFIVDPDVKGIMPFLKLDGETP